MLSKIYFLQIRFSDEFRKIHKKNNGDRPYLKKLHAQACNFTITVKFTINGPFNTGVPSDKLRGHLLYGRLDLSKKVYNQSFFLLFAIIR